MPETEPEFYKLPLHIDAARLRQEVSQFDEQDWHVLPGEAGGHAAIILVSVGGTQNVDFAISGPMQPTPFLARCPYLQQVLRALEHPVSRCRVIRLPGGTATIARHDRNYHWFRRMPVYIPIITNPAVKLCCQNQHINMAAGEAWTFDHYQRHWMVNESSDTCIHLVVEIRASLTQLAPLSQAEQLAQHAQNRAIAHAPAPDVPVPVEPYCFEVLTPQEITELTAEIVADAQQAQMPQETLSPLIQQLEAFRQAWAMTFAHFGHQHVGELAYQNLIVDFTERILPIVSRWLKQIDGRGIRASEVIRSMLFHTPPVPKRFNRQIMAKRQRKSGHVGQGEKLGPSFEQPVFIVSAPRAGSTLLFDLLARLPEVWTIAEESHEIIEGIPELHPAARNYHSNRLTEADAFPQIADSLRERFAQELQNREGRAYFDLPAEQRPCKVRFLEKTPKNALRIPFLKAVFPDARFVYLYREPHENINSLMEGWRSRRFVAYQDLPGWPYREWSFLLIPDWESLRDRSIVEIATYQWAITNRYILDDLRALPVSSWQLVRYADLIQHPERTLNMICNFAGLHWDSQSAQIVSRPLPISRFTLSAPAPDKWRKHAQEIEAVFPIFAPIVKRLERRENYGDLV
jgi:hypothetical protein